MENVKTFRVYNLLNVNGERLQLRLGYVVDEDCRPYNGNAGWRWSFEGKNIPMPVRSRTWFCGFPEHTMISWLNGNEWYVRTRVDLDDGSAEVYELPNGNKFDPSVSPIYEETLERVIYDLVNSKRNIDAVRLYRYAHGGSLCDAHRAVREIIDRQ